MSDQGEEKDKPFYHLVKTARALQNTPAQAKVVGQLSGAMAVLSSIHKNDTVKSLKTDKVIVMPTFLVTLGEPTPVIKPVMEALQKAMDTK